MDPSDAAPLDEATVDARADANAPRCTKDDALNVPSPVAGVGEPGQSVRFAALTRDELTIYFARATMADGGLVSDYQFVRATRGSRTARFSRAQPLKWSGSGEVAVPRVFDGVSEDECRFYFSRRENGVYTNLVSERSR